MPLSIKDPETERLARELARRTGESITVTTPKALQTAGLRLIQPKNSTTDPPPAMREAAYLMQC